MIWLLLIPLVLLIGLLVVDWHISAPGYNGPKSEHFDGTKFHNPDKIRGRGLYDMAKWAVTSDRGEWQKLNHDVVPVPSHQSRHTNTSEVAVTFVNHTTFLVQVDGLNILTDPIWSHRASPYSWVGPKRMRPPGIQFEELPPIDLVLISHNHYDHLDMPTVKRLHRQHEPAFITPLGVGQLLQNNTIGSTDLDWWDEHLFDDQIRINAVPAQHFSGRGVFDRDRTLWCGYVVETPSASLYFAGDTAYGSFFTDIGRAFEIDISLIPIGAYKPRWFMQPIHTDPDEAVKIHRDVQSTVSIGSHFGTFPLADEAMDEPKTDLDAARQQHGIAAKDFITLQEGQLEIIEPAPASMKIAGE